MTPAQDESQSQDPWELRELGVGQCWRSVIGPLTVYLQREVDAWAVGHEQADESPQSSQARAGPLDGFPEGIQASRYVFHQAPPGFRLRPALLDRPVVVGTDQPTNIPPGEDITFYISSPLCVVIEIPGLKTFLQELPVTRLSDTWFGSNTLEGDLCYAARTQARARREDLPQRAHRAVTPVTLRNRSSGFLSIDQLSIPVPLLSVYRDGDGSLWTDPITLEHADESPLARMKIDRVAAGLELLSKPRRAAEKSSLVRAAINILSG